jgi:transcriptional regulator with XRE-family HTH domain
MYVMPFGNIQLRAQKPMDSAYPKNLVSLGDHVRKRRLDLKLLQKEAAELMDVDMQTVVNWETNTHAPATHQIPKIIDFIGYVPYSKDFTDFKEKLLYYRKLSGLTQKKLAELLQVDETSIAKWERGKHTPIEKMLKKLEGFFSSYQDRLYRNK